MDSNYPIYTSDHGLYRRGSNECVKVAGVGVKGRGGVGEGPSRISKDDTHNEEYG